MSVPPAAGARGGQRVRAVLFDLDGVLVDSFEAWFALVEEVAAHLGCPPVSRAYLKACFGQGVEEDAKTLYPGRSETEIRAAYDERMGTHVHRVRANPEAGEVLGALAARGIRRGVVTNTQDTLVPGILEAAGLADGVEVVAAAGGGRREKPEPDLVRFALAGLDVPPEDALLVGDTDYDAEAARRAGTAFLRYDLADGGSLRAALARCTGL